MVQFPFELYDKLNQMRMAKAQEPLQQMQQVGQIGATLQLQKAQRAELELKKQQVIADAYSKLITAKFIPKIDTGKLDEVGKPILQDIGAEDYLTLLTPQKAIKPSETVKKNKIVFTKDGSDNLVYFNQDNNKFEEAMINGQPVKKDQYGGVTQLTDKGNAVKDKQQKEVNVRLSKLSDALDPSKSVRTAFGISKIGFDRAERLESLAETFKDKGQLDSRQIEELAIGLNSLLSGSNAGAQEQVKALVPKSAIGNAKKLYEWIANEPQGLNQRAFVERMIGSITREKNTMADQVSRTQLSRITQFSDLEKTNPTEFFDVLAGWGITKDMYNTWKKSGKIPGSAVQKPEGETNKPGGKVMVDAQGNRATVYPDGTFEEIK